MSSDAPPDAERARICCPVSTLHVHHVFHAAFACVQHACPHKRTAALRQGSFPLPPPPQQQPTEERGERLAGVARRMREITTSWGLALVLLHDSPDGELHVRMRSNMVTSAGIGNDSFCEVCTPPPLCSRPVPCWW